MATLSLIAGLASSLASLALNVLILRLILRQGLQRSLPWFFYYICVETVSAVGQLITWPLGDRVYQWMYWPAEGVVLCITVVVVRESFMRIFIGFKVLKWFPWLIRISVAAIACYSLWQTFFVPALNATKVTTFVVALEFTVRWGIVALSFVIWLMLAIFDLPRDTRENMVVEGLFLYSLGFLGAMVSRWVFGTRFSLFTQYLAPVGYLVAAVRWLAGLSRPETAAGFVTLRSSPEEISAELERYKQATARIMEIVSKKK